MTKFYVIDEASEHCSVGYIRRWEAEADLDEDRTFAWSTEAKVIEVEER